MGRATPTVGLFESSGVAGGCGTGTTGLAAGTVTAGDAGGEPLDATGAGLGPGKGAGAASFVGEARLSQNWALAW